MNGSQATHAPTVAWTMLDQDRVALRFEHVGSYPRFKLLLQRFRFDFLLARCEQIQDQPWWVIAVTQLDELVAFAQRNGMSLREE